MTTIPLRAALAYSVVLLTLVSIPQAQTPAVIAEAIIGEPNPVTPEISTAQLQQILREAKTPVLDVRSAKNTLSPTSQGASTITRRNWSR